MKKSSYASAAVLALAVALGAPAAAAAQRCGPARGPADVSASQCLAGGGLIIISSDGSGSGTFTQHCHGGSHDGETIV
ncbi:hypothetical protein [Streptomyces ziwulingensis]|uniref:Secreted protein n=1 Tax=Streptomyces ziwulingensis TaxID=1045501 RepID=A0ABP9B2N3_9ACTN